MFLIFLQPFFQVSYIVSHRSKLRLIFAHSVLNDNQSFGHCPVLVACLVIHRIHQQSMVQILCCQNEIGSYFSFFYSFWLSNFVWIARQYPTVSGMSLTGVNCDEVCDAGEARNNSTVFLKLLSERRSGRASEIDH